MTISPERFDFSFASYTGALQAYREDGYEVTGFSQYLQQKHDKHLILRHDIDNSFEQAVRVAKLEAELECTATYFLRIHAKGYNLFSLQSLQFIELLEGMGHEVQLHLEGGFSDCLGGTDIEWADRQRVAFETAVGRQLGGFSSHEPARMGGIEFANSMLERWSDSVRYHAYEDRFFPPNMKYLSDSSGRWREGHFAEWVGREPQVQVLTHPIWWFEKVPAENY